MSHLIFTCGMGLVFQRSPIDTTYNFGLSISLNFHWSVASIRNGNFLNEEFLHEYFWLFESYTVIMFWTLFWMIPQEKIHIFVQVNLVIGRECLCISNMSWLGYLCASILGHLTDLSGSSLSVWTEMRLIYLGEIRFDFAKVNFSCMYPFLIFKVLSPRHQRIWKETWYGEKRLYLYFDIDGQLKNYVLPSMGDEVLCCYLKQ